MEMPQRHLGRDAAEELVKRTLHQHGVVLPEAQWHARVITMEVAGKPPRQITVQQLVEEARTRGVPESLQRILDQRDPFFGGTFVMATDSHALTLSVEYAGYSTKLQGPCRIGPIEEELTTDILHFRRAACDASRRPSDLSASTRYYRGYLQASVSIVEAFLNRYAHLLKHQGNPRASILAGRRSLEERLLGWVDVVGGNSANILRGGHEWSQFSELRNERNRLVHAVEPFMGHRIPDMVRGLNFVRDGVGGLLIRLRHLAGMQALGFMLRLSTAPVVVERRQ
jgi:hypothetical protein